jgi:hypothetical protein
MPLQTPLDIFGELQAEVGGDKVLITAEMDSITVAVPNLRVLLTATRSAGPRKLRRHALSQAQRALDATSLNVHFQIGGGTVAALGPTARPGWLSRLLGVAPLQLKLSGLWYVLRTLWRRT